MQPTYRRSRHSGSAIHADPVARDHLLTRGVHRPDAHRRRTHHARRLPRPRRRAGRVKRRNRPRAPARRPPTPAISALVQQLKGASAYAVRREYTGRFNQAACVATCGRCPTSPSHAAAHPRRSSSTTSTDTPAHPDQRRAARGVRRYRLTPPFRTGLAPKSAPVTRVPAMTSTTPGRLYL